MRSITYGSVRLIRRDRTFAQKVQNAYLAGTDQMYATHAEFIGIVLGAAGSTGRQSSRDLPICGMLQNTVLGDVFADGDILGSKGYL